MSDPVRVGVIGCGLIAQGMHLPLLRDLAEADLHALCDLSVGTVTALGDRFGVEKRYTDHRDLLADDEVEAVAVLTYDHADVVLDAIEAGKHVLVEKPLAFTPDEGRAIVAAAERHGVTAMVGYMKVYDPGFEYAAERIRRMDDLRSIHVHDYAGRFAALRRVDIEPIIVDDLSGETAIRGKKWSPAVQQRVAEALGDAHGGYAGLYVMLLMLGSHDMALLREALGDPERVLYAQPVGDKRVLAVLEHAGGVPCVFDVGIGAQYDWWDEHFAVYGDHEEVRVQFDKPYYPYLPSVVQIKESVEGRLEQRTVPVSNDYGFRREWLHFVECVRTGTVPRTPLVDGLADIELSVDLIRAMPARTTQAPGTTVATA